MGKVPVQSATTEGDLVPINAFMRMQTFRLQIPEIPEMMQRRTAPRLAPQNQRWMLMPQKRLVGTWAFRVSIRQGKQGELCMLGTALAHEAFGGIH
jgi:hypothetical protein